PRLRSVTVLAPKTIDDLAFLRCAPPGVDSNPERPPIGVVDLFAGCGAMTIGALEGARRAGVSAELELAVDLSVPGLQVMEATLGIDGDRTAALDLARLLEEDAAGANAVAEDIAMRA